MPMTKKLPLQLPFPRGDPVDHIMSAKRQSFSTISKRVAPGTSGAVLTYPVGKFLGHDVPLYIYEAGMVYWVSALL
jgi:hypothetical protein